MRVDHGLARFERHVGQLRTARCPARRDDGFGAGQGRAGVLAIGIGHQQGVPLPGLGHIGDAGREDALFTGEFFVHVIGDPVRSKAQIRGGYRVAQPAQILATHHIPQPESHVKTAIGQTRNAAGQQSITALAAPCRQLGTRGFVEPRGQGLHKAELTAALQVSPHDRGHVLIDQAVVAEAHRRHRNLGHPGTGNLDAELGQHVLQWPGHQGECGGVGQKGPPRGLPVRSIQCLHS
ncbi:hypothetical protein D9M68_691580 [compost metagenome]